MSWEHFWAPNLVQWIVGGAITAVVGAIVGFIVRRWLRELILPIIGEQQQTKAFAKTAAVSSIESADAAKAAAKHAGDANGKAGTALTNSEKVNEALVFLAKQLGRENDRSEYLAEHNNRLMGALARERARNPVDDVEDAITITGKHRLHTALIDTGQFTTEPAPDVREDQQ